MKALVIYDSVFGNTEKVAQSIGSALAAAGETETIRVASASLQKLEGIDLLVVGSPTRKFSPTKGVTRFLKRLPAGSLSGVKVAAFDTRVSLSDVNSGILNFLVKLFGYAAEPIADRLQKKGGSLAQAPEGFIVNGSEGPMREGELERAAEWAARLVG
jgi:flavodoxin